MIIDDSPCDGSHGRFCPECAAINRWADAGNTQTVSKKDSIMTDTDLPTTGINVNHYPNWGWKITSEYSLTNEQAMAIKFIEEDPKKVILGEYVEVHDPNGVRTGHISRATYNTRPFDPDFISVEIDLS